MMLMRRIASQDPSGYYSTSPQGRRHATATATLVVTYQVPST